MNTETTVYTAKLEAAYRAGHSGDRAIEYASLIRGDSLESVQENAERLARVVSSIAAAQEPPPDRAVDHSQGMTNGDDPPAGDPHADFRAAFEKAVGR